MQPIRRSAQPILLDLNTLIARTLYHSSHVRVISDTPLIHQANLDEAKTEFDWHAFMETRWKDIDEPANSTLDTGGPSRLLNEDWSYRAGVRKQNSIGGEFQVSQEIGTEHSNSNFFTPQDQGRARVKLSYTQPLLRGRGRAYNTSVIVLAEIDVNMAHDEFLTKLQAHLVEVTRAYWTLYLERGLLLQKKRSLERAKAVFTVLEHRSGLDVVEYQIARAEAAVASRDSDLIRAETTVRDTESRLRSLVNDRQLGTSDQFELLPNRIPVVELVPVDVQTSFQTAITNRPELNHSLSQIRAAAIRRSVSKKDLLPALDLVLETYVDGLRGDYAIGPAIADQFRSGAPSYSVGLVFDVPIFNRAADARHRRRSIELRQFQNQFQLTVEQLRAEVEIAVRRVKTTHQEIRSRKIAMTAQEKEVGYVWERWRRLAGDDRSSGLILDNLLSAQERLAEAEAAFLRAQIEYNFALTGLNRTTGSLLQHENIQPNGSGQK